MPTVLHLMPLTEWRRLVPGAPVISPSLASEGFVHCTDDLSVLLQVANAFYSALPGDFVVLHIEVSNLTSVCVWEEPAPIVDGEKPFAPEFPHIYGPIDREAIVGVQAVVRDATGAFTGYAPLSASN